MSWKAAAFTLLMSSSAAAESFESRAWRLRLETPAGWRLVSDGSARGGAVEFRPVATEGARIVVESQPFDSPGASDLGMIRRQLSSEIHNRYPEVTVVRETESRHGDYPAVEVIATLHLDDDAYHVLYRCVFARGRIYIFACASFESSFVTDLATYRTFLDRVEILSSEAAAALSTRPPLLTPLQVALGLLLFLPAGWLLRRASLARLSRGQRR
jgi:hypothetical protein